MLALIVTSGPIAVSWARAGTGGHRSDNARWRGQSRVAGCRVVRDAELEASGLLCDTIGGPQRLPASAGRREGLGQVKRVWRPAPGPDSYRRGSTRFYGDRRRTRFGPASTHQRDGHFARRRCAEHTLQALILMNDQASLECARAMSARILREAPARRFRPARLRLWSLHLAHARRTIRRSHAIVA